MARIALNRNPLDMDALIPELQEPVAIFGEPVSTDDAARIIGQLARVESLMKGGAWYTLPALQKEIKRRFGQLYSETSISARIRSLRKIGYTVTSRRTKHRSNLYEYQAATIMPNEDELKEMARVSDTLPSAADLDAIANESAIAAATSTNEAA